MMLTLRRRGLLAATSLCLSLLAMTASSFASATPRLQEPPEGGGGWTWSDCLYYSPAPPDSAKVMYFIVGSGKAAGTYYLDCRAVRHIKADHGFNSHTEDCINRVLVAAKSKQTSNSNDNNWLITASHWYSISGQVLFGYVVARKSDNRIVTAYTESDPVGTGSGNWSDCASDI
jgi:hypothetical protein